LRQRLSRTGLSEAECQVINVVDLVNEAFDVSTIDPYDESLYRERMITLAAYLDTINIDGLNIFDWTWGSGGP
jgi:hypothetical protein